MDDKEQLEQEHSVAMNEAAVERLQKEAQQQEALRQSEAIWFEEDEKITLRDGKEYSIPPLTFLHARRFAELVKTVDINAIIMNFATQNAVQYEGLIEIMKMAFKHYPEVDANYIDRNVDLRIAAQVIKAMLNANGLKN